MQKFTKLTGVAAPLMRDNVDTDAIIPGSQLLFVGKSGFGEGLFAEWRYDEATREDRAENPDFVLNREPYRDATILLAGVNFACGSSREPAVWALRDFGIRCVIAESYGHIFYNSCFKNGLLPVTLPLKQVEEIARQVNASQGRGLVTVDLIESTVIPPDEQRFGFEVADLYRNTLLEGLDAISATLRYKDLFDEFRQRDRVRRPWIYR
jgi:3-isopropylmalate/(R)-2-methylmalate dehydratase small subunit